MGIVLSARATSPINMFLKYIWCTDKWEGCHIGQRSFFPSSCFSANTHTHINIRWPLPRKELCASCLYCPTHGQPPIYLFLCFMPEYAKSLGWGEELDASLLFQIMAGGFFMVHTYQGQEGCNGTLCFALLNDFSITSIWNGNPEAL